MRNGAVRVVVAWSLIAALNSLIGLSFASHITHQVDRLFCHLALMFQGLP